MTFITSMSRESLRIDGAEFDRLLGHITSEVADDDEIHGEVSKRGGGVRALKLQDIPYYTSRILEISSVINKLKY